MVKEKRLQTLKAAFLELKSKLEKLDQDALRNRILDFEVLSEEDLDCKLSLGTQWENLQLLLTQVGYLRINLFQEYYERIQAAEKTEDVEKAVHLMNQYIQTIALPFIQERLHPSVFTRITNLFSTQTLPDAAETLKEWENRYEAWNTLQETEASAEQEATQEYEKMKTAFITLYTLSFSPSNFPPVATEPSH